MSEVQMFIRSGGVGRPNDANIKPAVLEAMKRLQRNATPESVSREVFLSLWRKIHWVTAQKYLDQLTEERILVKRPVKLFKKTIFYYDFIDL